jgi:hypothetical protein
MFENAPKSYKDPFWTNLASEAEQEYNLPKGLLRDILLKGERSNADQVSSAGARTPFQIIEPTRQGIQKNYGFDPYSTPKNSARGAAALLRESLDRNKGSVRKAVQEYHGGLDPKGYGPINAAYVNRVVGDMEPKQDDQVSELVRMYRERMGGKQQLEPADSGVNELVRAYKERMAAKQPTAQGNVLPEVVVTPDATEVMKAPPSTAESIFQGAVVDPLSGGAQLLTNLLPESVVNAGNRFNNYLAENTGLVAPIPEGGVNAMVKAQQQEYEARQGGGFDGARLAGAVLSPVNFALGASAPAAVSALGRVATGAGLGAVTGALQPVADGEYSDQLMKNVALGAAVGGAASGAGEAISRLISPKASTNADVKLMKELGVDVTPGQALGGNVSKAEQKAASIPLMGPQIEARRKTAIEQFSKAMFNKAGKPIGFKTDKVGFDAVSELDTAVNQAYKKAVEQTKAVRVDDKFLSSASNLSQMASEVADNGATKKALDTQIDKILSKVTKADAILPDTWKEFDSSLGQIARKTGNMDYKNAIRELQREWRNMAARSNPKQAKLFKDADAAYSQLSILERAAENAAKQEGVFSPNQLYRAARANAFSKTQVRQKTAPFMKEALAAERVLGNTVPNSGTAERLMTGGAIGGAGLGVNPAIIAAPVLGGLAYTAPGSKALAGLVTARPQFAQPIAEAIQKTSPLLGLLAPQVIKQ